MKNPIARCILLATLVSIGVSTIPVLAQSQEVSEEQRKLAMELAPAELQVEQIEMIDGVVQLTGQSPSMKHILIYVSKLLDDGVVGTHLHYLSNDNGQFRIDIGNPPSDAD